MDKPVSAGFSQVNNTMMADGNGMPLGRNPILVVDDDSAIRNLFVVALEEAGLTCEQARNGREALERIAKSSYDAVLLDNHMPEMDGIDVIRTLRSDDETATLPLILVTGAAEVSERVEGLQAGASDYLTKPVDIEELVARVRTQLRGQAAWSHKVESHLRERAAIARALAQIKPADTPEATAEIVCRELSLLHQLSGVTMFYFGDGDLVTPIGRYGIGMLGESVGESLDVDMSRRLRAKAADGPWTERGKDLGTRDATLAFAPLVADHRLLGLLMLATELTDSNAPASVVGSALSAAIDFSSVAAGLLAPALSERGRDQARHGLLDRIIDQQEFFPVFQPIVDLASKSIVGYETLTRFTDGMRPDLRFIEATLLGRSVDIEVATLRLALEQSKSLPPEAFLSINVSPALVLEHVGLAPLLASVTGSRDIVLELTEHERIDDYGQLRAAIDALGPDVRLSVDDAGSGFASLRHVLSLQPHFVKLDLSLVRDIHTDPARQALVTGIEYFATETESRLIAEGIETPEEMIVLQRLDVELGQGYLLGRPEPLNG